MDRTLLCGIDVHAAESQGMGNWCDVARYMAYEEEGAPGTIKYAMAESTCELQSSPKFKAWTKDKFDKTLRRPVIAEGGSARESLAQALTADKGQVYLRRNPVDGAWEPWVLRKTVPAEVPRRVLDDLADDMARARLERM